MARYSGTAVTTPQTLSSCPLPETLGIIPALVWAFRFHADGRAEPLDVDAPVERRGGLLWLHINLSDARAAAWIAGSSLPALGKEAFGNHADHQQLHALDNCIAGVVSDLAQDFTGTDDSVHHLHFAITERVLVSGRHRPLTGAARTREALEHGHVRLTTVAALFELIVQKVAEGIGFYVDELSLGLDTIEDRLARGGVLERRGDLGRVRRTSVRVHREIAGLRMVFQRLESDDLDSLPRDLQIGAGKLVQRLDAIDRDVVDLRDRARLLQEEIAAAIAEESNRSLAMLSVITAIFLPPTLISGVFGMNLKGLPFADDPDGSLYAFGLMAVSVIAVLLVLRWIGVLRR